MPSIVPCLAIDAAPKPRRSDTESYEARPARSEFCMVPESTENLAAELKAFALSSDDIASERNEPSSTVPPASIQLFTGSFTELSTPSSWMPRQRARTEPFPRGARMKAPPSMVYSPPSGSVLSVTVPDFAPNTGMTSFAATSVFVISMVPEL